MAYEAVPGRVSASFPNNDSVQPLYWAKKRGDQVSIVCTVWVMCFNLAEYPIHPFHQIIIVDFGLIRLGEKETIIIYKIVHRCLSQISLSESSVIVENESANCTL